MNIQDAKEYANLQPAGFDLDVEIDQQVFGIIRSQKRIKTTPNYSTQLDAAFSVVAKLTLDGADQEVPLHFKLVYAWWPERSFPQVQARASFDWQLTGSDSEAIYQAEADTVPLAICRAALQVMLAKGENQ